MNTLQALVLAAGLLVAALIVGSFSRYSLTFGAARDDGVLIAYRLDRLTGQTYYCAIPHGPGQPGALCPPIPGS